MAAATGGDRGRIESSFVAEVKSDLMGEQTILCGMLQAGSHRYDKLVADGKIRRIRRKLIQYGWETITEALKQGGITLMMDRLSNSAKLRITFAEQIAESLGFLYYKHMMDNIISGHFSATMMADWANGDKIYSHGVKQLAKQPLKMHQSRRHQNF